MSAPVAITPDVVAGEERLVLFAGPCVVESRELLHEVAGELVPLCAELGVQLVFKASYDKANRTSAASFRSIGRDEALAALADVKSTHRVPIVTDVHDVEQVAAAAEVADVLQIPAFLCRQTDLLMAAGATGRVVNVKKGQFMAPEDMGFALGKVTAGGGGGGALLTERGTTFGYHDLVVDYRSLSVMRQFAPVVFDATHSVQSPGGAGGSSGGAREYIVPLARAAVAVGVDGLFVETHPRPAEAMSDGPSMLPLEQMGDLLRSCLAIRSAVGATRA